MIKEELVRHLQNLPKNADIEIAIRSAGGNTIKLRNLIRVRQIFDKETQQYAARLICCASLADESEQLELIEQNRKQMERADQKRQQELEAIKARKKAKATEASTQEPSKAEQQTSEEESETSQQPETKN